MRNNAAAKSAPRRSLGEQVAELTKQELTEEGRRAERKWGLMAQSKRNRTDDYGPLQPVISRQDVLLIRDLVQEDGLAQVCEQIGVAQLTLMRVLAGFGERCKPSSTKHLREFLARVNGR